MMTKNKPINSNCNRGKKPLIIGMGLLAAVLTVAALLSLFFIKGNSFALYYKEKAILYYDINGEPQKFSDYGYSIYETGIAAASKDGKKLFYSLDERLFLSEPENPDSSNTVIAENVLKFYLHESGKMGLIEKRNEEPGRSLHYWTEDDGLKELEHAVQDVQISKNFKKIFYSANSTENDYSSKNIYFSENGQDGQLLAEGVQDWRINEDGSKLYFVKDGKLYSKNGTRDALCLSNGDDTIRILNVFDDGVYYQIYSPYDETEYRREKLAFHDGKKEYILDENFAEITATAEDKPIVFFASAEKPKFDNGEPWTPKCYVAVGKTVTEVSENTAIYSVRFTSNGKRMYFCEKEDGTYNLRYVDIRGKKTGKSKLYDTDVSDINNINLTSDENLYYFKNFHMNNSPEKCYGDLYCNKKCVDTAVLCEKLDYCEKTDTFAYLTVSDNETSALKKSINGKKGTLICEDVDDFTFTQNGDISFTVGVDKAWKRLYLNKKTDSPIDEKVYGLIKVLPWSDSDYVSLT